MEFLQERFNPGPIFGWVCVACLPLVPLIWWRARRAVPRAAIRFSSVRSIAALRPTWAMRTRFIIPLLRTGAVIALVIALARPQSGGEYRDLKEGIAIQMVLDISGSMAEEDFMMNGRRVRRLDAVKAVFENFVLGDSRVRGRENDLIGMTTFAMYADTRCPLTLDHGALRDLLVATDLPGWVNGRQVRQDPEANYTSLGDAIVLATDDLRRAGEQAVSGVPGAEPAKSKVMILLTDGANNPPEQFARTAPDPVEAAKVAATLGIKIYTIGAVGSAPQRRGFFRQRRAEVDEPTLRKIAKATNAQYFRATDTESLTTVYAEIDKLERKQTGERSFHDNVYAAKMAMITALALLMAELVLVNTRYRTIP